jgi:hypothetical protein
MWPHQTSVKIQLQYKWKGFYSTVTIFLGNIVYTDTFFFLFQLLYAFLISQSMLHAPHISTSLNSCPKKILHWVQITTLLNVQFLHPSSTLLPVMSKYSPQQKVHFHQNIKETFNCINKHNHNSKEK